MIEQNIQAVLEGIARNFNINVLSRQGLALGLLAVNNRSNEVSAERDVKEVLATFFELPDVRMEDGILVEALGKAVNVHERLSKPLSMQVSLKTGLPMRVIA